MKSKLRADHQIDSEGYRRLMRNRDNYALYKNEAVSRDMRARYQARIDAQTPIPIRLPTEGGWVQPDKGRPYFARLTPGTLILPPVMNIHPPLDHTQEMRARYF